MQIILLDKVVNLGGLGDVVKVKDGYARNFLIPTGRARRATAAAKAEFEARRAELEKEAAAKLAAAQGVGEQLRTRIRVAPDAVRERVEQEDVRAAEHGHREQQARAGGRRHRSGVA